MIDDWLTIRRGTAPLLVSIPHTGTEIPGILADRYVSRDLALYDTDWWIERLYDFAVDLGATVVRTSISRSVIDVNRDSSGQSLYPGQATTGLCPTTTFDGRPLYEDGAEPTAQDIADRLAIYHAPYHQALDEEIARLRRLNKKIVLYDCHSIRSVIPRLFEGELPNFNIGTNSGAACDPAVQTLTETICGESTFSQVSNGRFKGGWITRRCGAPEAGVHAIQMELACRGYMDEIDGLEPAPYDEARAAPMRAVLVRLLTGLRDWATGQT
ncbi:N-formylglutamate deformylase [Hartmannibacter diazotrophicus]|uniref:N-formylglutamate deformylase n=1 Tax=Hartmannibacter diazotrophicus TaxID=1482074 RepID=A0A2C9D2H6_9HYPH|nr:N-formylglutamate deformylase [Hartmannibacter diazotrophicus]SON53675.1 N-formylglutamate deformylase [Hartmannibacter diazotrophicus]